MPDYTIPGAVTCTAHYCGGLDLLHSLHFFLSQHWFQPYDGNGWSAGRDLHGLFVLLWMSTNLFGCSGDLSSSAGAISIYAPNTSPSFALNSGSGKRHHQDKDVTGEHEERQEPLCTLVDVVEANQYNRNTMWNAHNWLRGYGHTTMLRTLRSSLALGAVVAARGGVLFRIRITLFSHVPARRNA
ncbi:hypothetical protein M405DRAFT_839930 [Rhizopogon salebrosus TDB-379]|nr:hypothetical protein M405DRAFT_839930 [Rhizopogon salebrosus TDB-379]